MAGLLEYKCPCCGGSIKFDSTLQKVKCEYCDTEFDLETLQQYDQELSNEEPEDMSWAAPDPNAWTASELEGMRVYVCKSCGGEIVADETTAATACPYCGNPIVVMGNFSGDLKPDYVIPFKYDKKAAKEALMNHFKGKKLLPKVFKDENHIDEVKGVYVPYWLYSADAVADIRYRATRVRVWSDSQYNYQETSYYSVMRSGDLEFERVPVDGSSRMADDMMESLEPFDFNEAVDFQTAYLAGYLADKYDVTAEDGFPRASERVRNSTAEAFMDRCEFRLCTLSCLDSEYHLAGSEVYLRDEWPDGKVRRQPAGGQGCLLEVFPQHCRHHNCGDHRDQFPDVAALRRWRR